MIYNFFWFIQSNSITVGTSCVKLIKVNAILGLARSLQKYVFILKIIQQYKIFHTGTVT